METNDKKGWKKLKTQHKADDCNSVGAGEGQDQSKSAADHPSQGHATNAEGTGTGTHEPTLRAATTDSSRAPKNDNDERPTGGNVR